MRREVRAHGGIAFPRTRERMKAKGWEAKYIQFQVPCTGNILGTVTVDWGGEISTRHTDEEEKAMYAARVLGEQPCGCIRFRSLLCGSTREANPREVVNELLGGRTERERRIACWLVGEVRAKAKERKDIREREEDVEVLRKMGQPSIPEELVGSEMLQDVRNTLEQHCDWHVNVVMCGEVQVFWAGGTFFNRMFIDPAERLLTERDLPATRLFLSKTDARVEFGLGFFTLYRKGSWCFDDPRTGAKCLILHISQRKRPFSGKGLGEMLALVPKPYEPGGNERDHEPVKHYPKLERVLVGEDGKLRAFVEPLPRMSVATSGCYEVTEVEPGDPYPEPTDIRWI